MSSTEQTPETSLQTQAPPTWVNHYNTFAAVLALLYMGLLLLGCYIVFQDPFAASERAQDMANKGSAMIILSIPMIIMSAASLFFPRTRWAWIAHIIIAAFTTSSCCLAPIAAYIIMRYMDPEVKDYFGA